MGGNINRCSRCNVPKDDKRDGLCCICRTNGVGETANSCIICGQPAESGTRYCGGDRGCPVQEVGVMMDFIQFGSARLWLTEGNCTHAERNVCQQCAKLTVEEVEAVRQYAVHKMAVTGLNANAIRGVAR